MGRRTSKGSTTFTYDNDGRLIKQTDGTDVLEFIYDNSGLAGLKRNGTQYFYRRDTQGNIVAILDSNGSTVVKYVYDAWGNHAITDNDGNDIESGIGALNPFRYRGYYYDTETGLYYLQTRYYDPEVGRFISQDSIEYADPETINGLNLYAYCGNNPVMNVDPTGEFLFSFLIAIVAGAIVGGLVGGVVAKSKGDSFLSGFVSGALVGGVLGGALVLGGAAMLAIAGKAVGGFIVATTFAGKAALFGTTFMGTLAVSAGAGMSAYAIQESMNGREVNTREMIRQGMMTSFKGASAYITGMVLASTGAFDYLLKGVKWTFKETISWGMARSSFAFILQLPWRFGLQ